MKFLTKKTKDSRGRFRKAVLDRDIHCRAYVDGKICHQEPLDPHHITGRVSVIDDDPRNGLAVCRQHHSLITDGKLKVQASWLTQDQIAWIEKRKWVGWEQIEWD